MGVSFRVSRTGTRYRHKAPSDSAFRVQDDDETQNDAVPAIKKKTDHNSSILGKMSENKDVTKISDSDISFTLSLFPDGYSIGKPEENEDGVQAPINMPKVLHPFDRTSEVLFSAIECGQLPGDILDDIPFKFTDGRAFCEVRDYRKCTSEGRPDVALGLVSPIINRVRLRISLENLIKDVPAMVDNDWTYGDLMEVESRILKAIRPQLCLSPSPQLDRLSGTADPTKLNFEIRSMRRKRLQQISEFSMSSDSKNQGKRACVERISESSKRGDSGSLLQSSVNEFQNNASGIMLPLRNNSFGSDSSLLASTLASHQTKYHIAAGSPKMKDHWSGSLSNVSLPSPVGQDMMNPFGDNGNTMNVRRDDQDGHSSPLTNKKARLTAANGADGNVSHLGSQIDNSHGSDLQWKNTLLQQQQQQQYQMARYHNNNNGMPKFNQQGFEGGLNQEGAIPYTVGQHGTRYNLKEEPVETEGLDKSESNNVELQQSRLQQRMPQPFMRSGFVQPPLNNLGQPLDYNSRKDDTFQKRKLAQSPRVSAGGLPQSPLSSKSGEFSSGSAGPQFGGVVSSGLMASQKEKSTVTSLPFVGVNPSFTSNTAEAMQRQHHAQAAAKRRSNSLPKTPGISGVGSPASVGTMTVPINANSPPVGNHALADQSLLDRFSKIEAVTVRCQLNRKKNKMNEFPIRKQSPFSSQELARELVDLNSENLKDETCKMPLSNSLVGGNMNVCKTRILNFIQTEHVMQGNGFQLVPKGRTRMIMSEKPNDGTVAIHIGEIDDNEYLAAEDYLPTLPNTHMADLLAAQFCSLMARDGYHLEDHIQPNPVQMNHTSHQLNAPGVPPGGATAEMQQYPEGASGQLMNDIKPAISGNVLVNSTQNLPGPRMLPPGTNQAIQVSQGLLQGASSSRLQQPEQIPQMQQAQQNSLMQQEQFQRSPMMIGSNSMQNIAPNPNIHLGAHVGNKPSALQLQLLQHQHQQTPQQLLQSQQQQQQQSHMQRKMMAGVGGVGMGNIGNNMVGLGNFANVMGLSGVRGVTGTGMSTALGNMNQNPMNLSSASNITNAIRSGALTQAALMKMRLAQSGRTNVMGSAQANIGAIPGARQMNPGPGGLSMIGSTLNRGNMNQMQRTAMGAMGPPKLIPGMNAYMNQQLYQQQSQLQQMQQQQQMQQLQQQQQLQQTQETTSPLQSVISPQMGSPSSVGIPIQMNQPSQQQQQASPQQMSQRTPMSPQISAGAMHAMSSGNPEANPTSPQVSSQTMGSVGSIANSPLELQAVNKSNSANNA